MLTKRIYIKRCYSSKFAWPDVIAHYNKQYGHGEDERNGSGAPFRMVLPPPNVTGVLHIGHALTATVEDATCRFRRLQGRRVQWLAGFDHAGIATQTAVEKMLWKRERRRRHDLSADEFLAKCEEWKKGGNKLVNWSPSLRSTISDEEVELVSTEKFVYIPDPNGGTRKVRVGVMHKVRYPVVEPGPGDPTHLVVATTRPETIFADTCLAVHPGDVLYGDLDARMVRNPLTNRLMPVIKSELVDPEQGTGVLKVTPGCSKTDHNIYTNSAIKHQLSVDVVVDEQGRLTAICGEFEGVDRFDAREKVSSTLSYNMVQVVQKLEALGAYAGFDELPSTTLPMCSRSGDVCEVRPMDQWFLNTSDLNEQTLSAIERGQIKIGPDYAEFALRTWLENKEPWCLSRQLVWGHRVPAYSDDSGRLTSAKSKGEAARNLECSELDLQQDTDVLDTWYSSALVPIVVGGAWPKQPIHGPTLDLMETGHDIVGFWVARMLTLCYGLTGHFPFHTVSLHGMIRDGQGQKMSKSKGNVIDPLSVINGATLDELVQELKTSNLSEEELGHALAASGAQFPNGIKPYGADVLRFVLMRRNTQAKDIAVDLVGLAEEGFKLGNKLANMTRFVDMVSETALQMRSDGDVVPEETVAEEWIRSRLTKTAQAYRTGMEEGRVHHAFEAVYAFMINDFCDVYLESAKKPLWAKNHQRLEAISSVLGECAEMSLAMWSAFMPMLCNYLLDRSAHLHNRRFIDFDNLPPPHPTVDREMRLALAMVSLARGARGRLGLTDQTALDASLVSTELNQHFLAKFGPLLRDLANLNVLGARAVQVEDNLNVLNVPGTDAVLVLHMDSEDPQVAAQLAKQLQERRRATAKRVDQLNAIIAKYDKYAADVEQKPAKTKGDLKQQRKHEKKASQARKARESALKELCKLDKLVQKTSNPDEKDALAG